jgi:hypothetical protein
MNQPHTPALRKPPEYFWPWVMCVLGVDYFSSLAYQPSITFQVAGRLGPFATLVVVLITLAGALPIYWYVAGKSPHGQGSIALLERLVQGWRGKTLVLVLLGFAATDFIMVKTISLADAAVHVIGNDFPPWQDALESLADLSNEHSRPIMGQAVTTFFNKQLVVTLLLGFLGFIFWFLLRKGFTRNVIVLAVPLVGVYLLLNGILIGSGIVHLARNPDLVAGWLDHVRQGNWQAERGGLLASVAGLVDGWGSVVLLCLIFFPRLSLGLSGFELSLILMPQIKGHSSDDPGRPAGRIRNARKVLISAALVMSLFLLGSVMVTTLLIPVEELRPEGAAANRALAYLAHGGRLVGQHDAVCFLCGNLFGTVYDVATILLLCLAGTSVMTALAVLMPQFLLRFGMELRWTQRWGVLLILFGSVNLAVTLYFRASVTAQRGAYATAVLVLFTTASVATALDKLRRRGSSRPSLWRILLGRAGLTVLIFASSAAAVILDAPSGLLIAAGFIAVLFIMSIAVRALRTNELRTVSFDFKDEHSKFLWDSLRLADFPVLVPHRPGRHERDLKEEQIRRDHQLDPTSDVVFIEVEVDDPSNFLQNLLIEVFQEGNRFVIKVTRCVSVAHAIAAIAVEMSKESKPPGLHFGWSEMDLMTASWSYFAFGEGNVPWKVRELMQRAEPDPERRPRVIIG